MNKCMNESLGPALPLVEFHMWLLDSTKAEILILADVDVFHIFAMAQKIYILTDPKLPRMNPLTV